MSSPAPHIAVCICTYKRERFLRKLLAALKEQRTDSQFTYSIVVADNDPAQSAKPVAEEFASSSGIATVYCVQPEQNIALTRNTALAHAQGDFIAFIDDDEYPIRDWLWILFTTCQKHQVDGVLGPVFPEYEVAPPRWVLQGKFHERPSYPTGFVIDWKKGRTGNVLLKRAVFDGESQPFRPNFLTGEDQDFFRRMIERKRVFIWCHEAMAYEIVPAIRWNRRFLLRRALLRGKISLNHPTSRGKDLIKSAIAVPAYALALPFCFLAGQHHLMKYLIKTFDHAGRLLAFVGIDPIKEKYVTE